MGGLIVKSEDDHFRSLRNDYLPTFKQGYDDKFQYVPFDARTEDRRCAPVAVPGDECWCRMPFPRC